MLRLANNEGLSFRNANNSADKLFKLDSSDKWSFGASALSEAELGYLSGVTSAIQTQLNAKVGTSDVIAIDKGGTGQTTANAALNALLPTQTGNANKVLATDGTDSNWTAVATTVTTTEGDLIYRNASADTRLAGNTTTTKKFLTQTGDGSASAAPAWDTIATDDVPLVKNGYYGNTPATWGGSVSLSNNGNTGVVLSNTTTDSDYIDSYSASGSTETVTFARAGYYRVCGSLRTSSSAGLTALFLRHAYTNNGSGASIICPTNNTSGTVTYTLNVPITGSQDGCLNSEVIVYISASGQSITFFNSVTATFSSGTATCFGGLTVTPL